MIAEPFSLRRATMADSAEILAWRNNPATRANSLNSAVIKQEIHTSWLQRALADPDRDIWIADQDGASIALIRFDVAADTKSAEVSINIAPSHRGKGLARPLLESGAAQFLITRPSIHTLTAQIRSDNPASIRAFEHAGYVFMDEVNEVGRYQKHLE